MVVCRDCLHEGGHAARCPACGSPRLLADPGPALAIAHVDCDAFYAAVEKRDYPELRDKPVIVGGGRRGVVTTACYVARIDGVRSAMPMFKALTACPHAVVVKPRMDRYVEVGREVRRLMRDLTPAIEPVSIDEAFLDLSGTDRVHGASPAVTLVRFAHRVEAELGITVSVGLAPNKFLAKVASDLEKPRGFTVIRSDEARTFLAERTVGIIPGIGAAAQARLARAGIVLIRHLTERPAADLAQVVGRDAERLRSLAVGVDGRPVRLSREAKGVSAETTLNADLADYEALQPVLWRLSERVALRLKRSGLAGRSVTLKLKNRTFRLRTRARSGLPPTQLATRLYEAALPLLRAECDGPTFRLIGIGASDLCDGAEADRGDLADAGVVRDAQREAAIDRLRERFGPDAVRRGLSLRGPQR